MCVCADVVGCMCMCVWVYVYVCGFNKIRIRSSFQYFRPIYLLGLRYVSAYDVNDVPWGETAASAWVPLALDKYMCGGFVWTGFDYKGEPTPYGWPNVNSHCKWVVKREFALQVRHSFFDTYAHMTSSHPEGVYPRM